MKLNKAQLVSILEESNVECSMRMTRQELLDLYHAMQDETVETCSDHPVIMVTEAKNDKTTTRIDAAQFEPVSPEQVADAGNIMHQLACNCLAGRVHPDIEDQAAIRGGIKRMFNKTRISDADINALKFCLDQRPEAMRTAWEQYAADRKRVRCISLQGIRKAMISGGAGAEKKVPFKDRFVEIWSALPADVQSDPRLSDLLNLYIDITPDNKD
jgi:hypothetical protein